MTLDELISPIHGRLGVLERSGDQRVTIADLTDDSRKVGPGSLFVAVQGERVDGHQFLDPVVAAGAAGYVGFAWPLPFGIHLIVAVAMGMLAGAIWGGIVGLLKARTGAHEVIVTIMLNYVAYYLIAFLLRTPGALQAPGSTNPKSPAMLPTAVFPELFGPKYNLHLGFLFAIAATIWVWYLINLSNLGFQFRAVGENPNAARVAGMNVKNIYVYAMLISGGLIGLAGVAQVLGTVTTGFTQGIDAGIGFDAITVALLGRSRPIGVFFAGILFGALKAGGYSMQAAQGVPIDICLLYTSDAADELPCVDLGGRRLL